MIYFFRTPFMFFPRLVTISVLLLMVGCHSRTEMKSEVRCADGSGIEMSVTYLENRRADPIAGSTDKSDYVTAVRRSGREAKIQGWLLSEGAHCGKTAFFLGGEGDQFGVNPQLFSWDGARIKRVSESGPVEKFAVSLDERYAALMFLREKIVFVEIQTGKTVAEEKISGTFDRLDWSGKKLLLSGPSGDLSILPRLAQ
ncbi:MAG TPA: hypothetical protein PKK76_02015 [Leptospiraceae bacterium]|nr:hypothetical protein [Leptospiraceae bacterium]